jgi:hypothetical protein
MERYDKNYRRNFIPAIIGIILIIANFYLSKSADVIQENLQNFLIITLVLRVFLALWVHRLAMNLNSEGYWGLLCFVLPSLTLIWISFIKKTRKGYYELQKINPSLHQEFVKEVVIIERALIDSLLTEKEFKKAFSDLTSKYISLTVELNKEYEIEIRTEKIKQLENLRDRGILTEEEFSKKINSLN